MAAGLQLLEAARLTRIMYALQDVRDLPQALLFSKRVVDVDAVEGEIMGKFIGHVQIADIVGDDAKAAVYSTGKLQYETTNVPNLKHGVAMSQAMLNQLNAVQTLGTPNDQGIFSNYRKTQIDRLLLGIRQRKEALAVAMYLDGFTYDRLGIKMTNVSWGMPSDLKVTVSTAWDNSSATPMSDILLQKRYAAVRYGEYYDQIDMSTAAFNFMTLTTDFQNRARYYLPGGIAASALPNLSEEEIMPVVKKVLGVSVINLYDARYWQQAEDGTVASAPYLPITKVVLSSTADNGDPTAHDFANGVVTESLIGGLAPTNMIGAFSGPTRGPVAYATAPADLNPPNLTLWGVARGFPRKYRMAASSVLTVGTFTDPIPTTDVAFT
jgi:hypothetical protein